jgi:RNA polymerase sigma-70 factor (ECF subfamily)
VSLKIGESQDSEHHEHSDEHLLECIRRQGDSRRGREAASQLFKRYREPVYHWCMRRVRDHEEALDLAQDVLLSAWRNLDSYQGSGRFASWLFAIARNRCLNALRRPDLFEPAAPEPDQLAAPGIGQDHELEQREAEDRLLALVRDNLDPLDQEVLWLRCFERMPVDAITEVLDISEASGARGVLQRARRRLRAALDRADETQRGGEQR